MPLCGARLDRAMQGQSRIHTISRTLTEAAGHDKRMTRGPFPILAVKQRPPLDPIDTDDLSREYGLEFRTSGMEAFYSCRNEAQSRQ